MEMQNLWSLIEKAKTNDALNYLSGNAESELYDIKEKLEEYEKTGENYAPLEYPKMLANGKVVYNADEETKATGFPISLPVKDPAIESTSEPVEPVDVVVTPVAPIVSDDEGHTGGNP